MSFQSELPPSTPQSTPQSTPPPGTTPSTPPPIRVPRITRNDIIPRIRPRRTALFSPTPISTRLPNNNLESIIIRQSSQEELFVRPPRIPALPAVTSVVSEEHPPVISSVLTPENSEYWRVNWRAFLNNPIAFADAIKISPAEYQEDINKVLDVQRRGTNHSQPRRL